MRVKAKAGVVHLEAEELEEPPVNQWKLRESHGTNSPLQHAEDANLDDTQMSSLQNCCLSHPVLDVILCYDSPSKQLQEVCEAPGPIIKKFKYIKKVYRITKEIKHIKILLSIFFSKTTFKCSHKCTSY